MDSSLKMGSLWWKLPRFYWFGFASSAPVAVSPIPQQSPHPCPHTNCFLKSPVLDLPVLVEQMCSVACRLHLNSTASSAIAVIPSNCTNLAASARYWCFFCSDQSLPVTLPLLLKMCECPAVPESWVLLGLGVFYSEMGTILHPFLKFHVLGFSCNHIEIFTENDSSHFEGFCF